MDLKNPTDNVNALIDSYIIGEYFHVSKKDIDNAIKNLFRDKLEDKIASEIQQIANTSKPRFG